MHDFLVWLGWYYDSAFWPPQAAQTFWSTPLGLACTAVLCVTSTIRVIHRQSSAGLFDTLWHLAMTVTMLSAFWIGLYGTPPHQLVKTMLVLMAVRGLYKVLVLQKADRNEQRSG